MAQDSREHEALRFLSLWHEAGALDGERFAVWPLSTQRTQWFKDPAAAAKVAAGLSGKSDVYFSVGRYAEPPKTGRGKEDLVTSIPGLWLDVDVDDGEVERGKADRLPKTSGEARAMIDALMLPPSVLVHSGHGYQAYWLLKEPLAIATPDDREAARKLTIGWHETAKAIALDAGFTIDSTFDLTRVMRIPGTQNLKGKEPREARIIAPETADVDVFAPRYVPDDFAERFVPEFLRVGGAAHQPKAVIVPARPVAGRAGVPRPAMIDLMMENDPRFRKTWERKRGDFKDTSASAYDMAIAAAMAASGADDQQIADAILAWRTTHNDRPQKAQRRDYVMRTISAARTRLAADASIQNVAAVIATEPARAARPESEDTENDVRRRETLLADVSRALNVRIVRVIKHGAERASYSLILDGARDVTIGPVESMISQDKFRARLAEATATVIGLRKKEDWNAMAQAMLQSAVLVLNEESSRARQCLELVLPYLSNAQHSIWGDARWANALPESDPFVRDGVLHVATKPIKAYWHKEQIKDPDLWESMRAAGFESAVVNGRGPGGKQYSRSYWSISLEDAGGEVVLALRNEVETRKEREEQSA